MTPNPSFMNNKLPMMFFMFYSLNLAYFLFCVNISAKPFSATWAVDGMFFERIFNMAGPNMSQNCPGTEWLALRVFSLMQTFTGSPWFPSSPDYCSEVLLHFITKWIYSIKYIVVYFIVGFWNKFTSSLLFLAIGVRMFNHSCQVNWNF